MTFASLQRVVSDQYDFARSPTWKWKSSGHLRFMKNVVVHYAETTIFSQR